MGGNEPDEAGVQHTGAIDVADIARAKENAPERKSGAAEKALALKLLTGAVVCFDRLAELADEATVWANRVESRYLRARSCRGAAL
jgi:hypothetical protein